MPRTDHAARMAARDSLSNLAASLGTGRDKAAHDAFFVADLARDQVEAMYRGDWLARKIVDIVPYDCVREWREWSGERTAVTAIERAEQGLGLRKAVQRAMILGRLYGGGAILLGTDASDAADLALPLHSEAVGPGALRFLHVVSRWQLAVDDIIRDPLSPWYGEPSLYRLTSTERGELALHPSRVVRFLGNALPDPLLYGAQLWSDSVLQTLYDAIHGVALTQAGATSLLHEAKVDIITVPGLAEHLSNAATTNQLSARFAYANAMKSINNLLLLGDGESWQRQQVDFGGLPDLVKTFLQVAAGAADIPITRLLGQSPAGLSSTGESDVRNYYDMISARQELDLRPQLERIDRYLLRSAGVDPATIGFEFRPLWQLSAAEKAAVALQKAQATQIYAGLNLWPAATMASLVQAQLAEDGTYPNAERVFAAVGLAPSSQTQSLDATFNLHFNRNEARGPDGRWIESQGGQAASVIPISGHGHRPNGDDPPDSDNESERNFQEDLKELGDPLLGGVRFRPDGTVSVVPPVGAGAPYEGTGELPRSDLGSKQDLPSNPEPDGTLKPVEPELPPKPNNPNPDNLLGRVPHGPDEAPPDDVPRPGGPRLPRGGYGSIIKAKDVTIQIKGPNRLAQGYSYEQGIRNAFGSLAKRDIFVDGVGKVDDVVDGGRLAFEAKYIENFARSPYNPEYHPGYPHTEVEDTVNELTTRARYFARGVIIFTNSEEFAAAYNRLLAARKIVKYRFIVTGASR